MKIMVVDDSIVFRTQISLALKDISGVEVTAVAANGKIAIQKLAQNPVDLITLDMEMPELNGIETLKAIRSTNKSVKILVYSSQTISGAEKALEALREGADDVIAKPSGLSLNFETAQEAIRSALVPKVIQFTDQRLTTLKEENLLQPTASDNFTFPSIYRKKVSETFIRCNLDTLNPSVVVIASSTGGPTALDYIFSKIPGPYKIPVLLVQHMPPVFTQILARRLGELTGVSTKEVSDGDLIEQNKIYVAQGDHHFKLQKENNFIKACITKEDFRNSIRPAADFLFETAAEIYRNKCLGVVLTGMGEDGCDGAIAIKRANGGILIQDKESCTVFGMPGSVFDVGAYDEIGNLDYITQKLHSVLKGF